MKIFVDENTALVIVSELENLGHDVLDIRGTSEQGIADDLLWEKVFGEIFERESDLFKIIRKPTESNVTISLELYL